jgi:hypothetical protein
MPRPLPSQKTRGTPIRWTDLVSTFPMPSLSLAALVAETVLQGDTSSPNTPLRGGGSVRPPTDTTSVPIR